MININNIQTTTGARIFFPNVCNNPSMYPGTGTVRIYGGIDSVCNARLLLIVSMKKGLEGLTHSKTQIIVGIRIIFIIKI